MTQRDGRGLLSRSTVSNQAGWKGKKHSTWRRMPRRIVMLGAHGSPVMQRDGREDGAPTASNQAKQWEKFSLADDNLITRG